MKALIVICLLVGGCAATNEQLNKDYHNMSMKPRIEYGQLTREASTIEIVNPFNKTIYVTIDCNGWYEYVEVGVPAGQRTVIIAPASNYREQCSIEGWRL